MRHDLSRIIKGVEGSGDFMFLACSFVIQASLLYQQTLEKAFLESILTMTLKG